MKKFIKSYLTAFTIITAVLINGCDIFESFQFGLPLSFEIESQGANNPSGSQIFCFDSDDTYQQYADDINSINFVAAYIVTLEVTPATLAGNAILRLYEYNQNTQQLGQLIFEHISPNLMPVDHDSTNAYKVELTGDQITELNESLAGGGRCFYGEYEVQVTNGGVTNYVRVRIDALFNIDTKLD